MLRFFKLLLIFFSVVWLNKTGYGQYWFQPGGGLTIDEGYAISSDNNGNSYITGYFTGTADFGASTLNSAGSSDIFVAKLNNAGSYDWAVQAGGTGSDRGFSIATDSQGNSYVTGFFTGSADFSGQTVVSAGAQDIFIAKYNAAGVLQWVESAGGAGADIGNGITLDNQDNPIVTGEFNGSSSFGAVTLVSTAGTPDVFISKLDGAGAFSWTQQGASDATNKGVEVACDNAGNIYATGQFGDTITFDITHNNASLNSIYLVKFDPSGQEQWFRKIGAASSNTVYDVESNANGDVFVVGDFTGVSLTFFGAPNNQLNSPHINNVFVARYNDSGSYQWSYAEGSASEVSARAAVLSASNDVYITGHFQCRFDSHADSYGQGAFNSVGFNDMFISHISAGGQWISARQFGSRDEDYAYGIALDNGNPVITGSFKQELFVPVSADLNNGNSYNCTGNSGYCNDANYDLFNGLNSNGNSDVFIGNVFDLSREPYDYYQRSGSGCNRDYIGVCIEAGCPAVINACNGDVLTAFSNTCADIGPDFNYSWSNGPGSANQSPSINGSGDYSVTMTSDDGCFVSRDTITYNILPLPTQPTLTDDKGINIDEIDPDPIELCLPDSTLLTGGNYGNNSILWEGPGLGAGVAVDSIMVTQSGNYTFSVIDSNGCENSVTVEVDFFQDIPVWDLEMALDDTVEVCEGQQFAVVLYDSISNPAATVDCFNQYDFDVVTNFTVTPAPIGSNKLCETVIYVTPDTSGTHVISVEVIRTTACDTSVLTITDSIEVIVNPVPNPPVFSLSITGSPYYCPGDSTTLYASGGGTNFLWNGPNVNGLTTDSVFAFTPGVYSVTATESVTNQFNCTSNTTEQATIQVGPKPQPAISANSSVICPNDSVLITVDSGGVSGFLWEGPNGVIPQNTGSIYAYDPGTYFVLVNDSDNCGLVSNSVDLFQYTTPDLIANGDTILCGGDSVTISILSSPGSSIQWLSPLSGDSNIQVIDQPGTYTAEITACNITTSASLQIVGSYAEAEINAPPVLCEDSSVVLYATPNMETYLWYPGMQTSDSIVVSSPGVYQLATSDSNNCTAESDSVTVDLVAISSNVQLNEDTVLCPGDSLTLEGSAGFNQYVWQPGGLTSQDITVNQPGSYTLTVFDTNGCFDTSDPIELTLADTQAIIDTVGTTFFCEGDSVILAGLGLGIEHFVWLPAGDTSQTITISQSGTYQLLTLDTFGCQAFSESVTVEVEENLLTAPTGFDTNICSGTSIVLQATSPLGEINWYLPNVGIPVGTGTSFQTPILEDTITYYLVSEQSVCASESTAVTVEVVDCGAFNAPNIFTPNGDGVNDIWYPQIAFESCFKCRIYNRWGALVTAFDRPLRGWDGTYRDSGGQVEDGTYFYILEYCNFTGSTTQKTGYIQVLH